MAAEIWREGSEIRTPIPSHLPAAARAFLGNPCPSCVEGCLARGISSEKEIAACVESVRNPSLSLSFYTPRPSLHRNPHSESDLMTVLIMRSYLGFPICSARPAET